MKSNRIHETDLDSAVFVIITAHRASFRRSTDGKYCITWYTDHRSWRLQHSPCTRSGLNRCTRSGLNRCTRSGLNRCTRGGPSRKARQWYLVQISISFLRKSTWQARSASTSAFEIISGAIFPVPAMSLQRVWNVRNTPDPGRMFQYPSSAH